MTVLHQQLLQVFDQFEDHVAIAHRSGTSISYGQLNHHVADLLGRFTAVSKGDSVVLGILSTRCAEAYIGVLSAFFAHVRFVPLNPGLPVSRLKQIISAGNINIVLFDFSNTQLAESLDVQSLEILTETKSVDRLQLDSKKNYEVSEDAIAYQMFTSGSTGAPKGVPISYNSLNHYVVELKRELKFPEYARYSQLFDLSFDLAMHDIFITFSSGGTLVPASSMDLMMPHDYIRKDKVDIWFSVPMLALVANRGQAKKTVEHKLKKALFCGEALITDYAMGFKRFLSDEGAIYNLYGPTEATIAFTIKKLEEQDADFPTVPLGSGFGQNRIAIDTEEGVKSVLHEGMQGELLLGGPQVFDGYRPEVPIDCFIESKVQTYYRSGDNVEVVSNQLIHKGRIDSQIKFRGYRIELGDIETTFRRIFDCSTTVAILVGQGEKTEIALAYDHTSEITDFSPLQDALPSYMLPTKFVQLETVPTNVNGKVDRKAIKNLVEKLG